MHAADPEYALSLEARSLCAKVANTLTNIASNRLSGTSTAAVYAMQIQRHLEQPELQTDEAQGPAQFDFAAFQYPIIPGIGGGFDFDVGSYLSAEDLRWW